MKSIRRKILFLTLLPFLTIYSVLSAFIVYQVYRLQLREIQLHLHHMALHNESNLRSCYELLEISVQFCAAEMAEIDPADPSARQKGERVITARFRNPQVINVWLAFEPNAFDGKDALHTNDYSGAPSGRYIRSFARQGDSWTMLNDIQESKLNNTEESFYYTIPVKTGRFFSNLGSHSLLWDYGKGAVTRITVTMPVYRNGTVIGCVGLDAAINDETLGSINYPHLRPAIFLPSGEIAYSRNIQNSGKTIAELGFKNSERVLELMRKSEAGYFTDTYGETVVETSTVKVLSYFYPVNINNQYIYMAVSLPRREIWFQTIPVLLPIGLLFLSTLVAFSFLFVYLSRGIASPLRNLTEASERIVAGDLDISINTVKSQDEMGMISKSLARMAEQFRVGRYLQELYTDRFYVLLKIHYALFRSSSLGEAFETMLKEVAGYYKITRGSLVYAGKDKPKIAASYPTNEAEGLEFYDHVEVSRLLEGKKHFTVNGGALTALELSFLDPRTQSLCIVPLKVHDALSGYIIMEGKQNETLVHDDTTLLFISDVLSYIINFRAEWEQELTRTVPRASTALSSEPETAGVPELSMADNTVDFLEKARSIPNLNVDKGVLLLGGEKQKYTELLKVTVKVISEEILKMRRLHTWDLAAFAIEVHGIKSALFNIGAETLGDEARQLEFAAKSDDAEYCRENYPALEEKLRIFARHLAALFPREEQSSRKGSVEELEKTLTLAKEACDNFDVSAANALLAPLAGLQWNRDIIQKSLRSILGDMENLEYDSVKGKIMSLLAAIQEPSK